MYHLPVLKAWIQDQDINKAGSLRSSWTARWPSSSYVLTWSSPTVHIYVLFSSYMTLSDWLTAHFRPLFYLILFKDSPPDILVTKLGFILLTIQQANKLRDENVEARNNSNLIQKVSRPRSRWTSVPKTHLLQVRIQTSFINIKKEEEMGISCCKLLNVRILCSCSWMLSLAKMFL